MIHSKMLNTLYNDDFQGWIEATIHHLESQQFDQLDIQNLSLFHQIRKADLSENLESP